MKKDYEIEEYERFYRGRDLKGNRVILHSDLNNFFASVETVYEPALRNVPFAICGDIEARHGIVLAKNEYAKRYGIRTGETVKDAKRKCEFLVIRPTHYDEYVKYSRKVRELYMEYATRIEPFGIDEAWIDISDLARRGNEELFATGRSIAEEIRYRVKNELGLTVSVGVSFNKIFSKLASDMKKPDAVTLISYGEFKDIIWQMPVNELLFVGRKTAEAFKTLEIKTVGDLAQCKRNDLKSLLGKFGETLWDSANGYDLSPVSFYDNDDSTASISNSTTTPYDITAESEAAAVLTPLSEEVTEQMRKRGINACTVKIFVKYSNFSSFMRQIKIAPTNNTGRVFSTALSLLIKNWDKTIPIRTLGVGVEGFTQCITQQQDVFNIKTKLDGVMDSLRIKYGDGVIKRGSVMQNSLLTSFDKKHVAFNSNI